MDLVCTLFFPLIGEWLSASCFSVIKIMYRFYLLNNWKENRTLMIFCPSTMVGPWSSFLVFCTFCKFLNINLWPMYTPSNVTFNEPCKWLQLCSENSLWNRKPIQNFWVKVNYLNHSMDIFSTGTSFLIPSCFMEIHRLQRPTWKINV